MIGIIQYQISLPRDVDFSIFHTMLEFPVLLLQVFSGELIRRMLEYDVVEEKTYPDFSEI